LRIAHKNCFGRRLKPFRKIAGKVNFGKLTAPTRPMETFDGAVVKRKLPETQQLFLAMQTKRRANPEDLRA
jgi:hypothetical protein